MVGLKRHNYWWNRLDRIDGRVEQAELLDLGAGTPADVAENLADMQRINDLLGGTRMLIRCLLQRLLAHHQSATILDLGTGGGGIPLAILRQVRRLRRAGRKPAVRILGIDRSERSLAVAAQNLAGLPEVSLLHADAQCLPFSPGQVDYVISSLFLHHFAPDQLRSLLRHAYDLAGRAIVMSDLVRGQAPYLAFLAARPILARNYLTRHDGALSIRRAYTPDELYHLALAAGLPEPRVIQHWPWRMTLVVDK